MSIYYKNITENYIPNLIVQQVVSKSKEEANVRIYLELLTLLSEVSRTLACRPRKLFTATSKIVGRNFTLMSLRFYLNIIDV